MVREQVAFWLIIFTGSIFAGWWLSVRPSAPMRTIAAPVALLAVTMSLLLCLVCLTGEGPPPAFYSAQYAGLSR